ncbi:MAG: AAA family ATPase [Bacteroidota bacterium]
MIRVPYGISNFETLISDGSIYIDRTNYIETLEHLSWRYLFFLRPRKFGKSLFLSLLDHYYNINHKHQFDLLFGQYYIGQNPTPLANQYLILQFDFSQIDTSSFENTFNGFLNNVKMGASIFYGSYPQFFSEEDIKRVETYDFPAKVIQDVLKQVGIKIPNQKIYLLIDEYDHFANEILSFRYNDFMDMVGKNGFVRKFYEAIKVGTFKGVIDRLFVTGVSPITLDSLTSGFNIATNISLEKTFNEMTGFSEVEVLEILKGVEVPESDLNRVMQDMRAWYNSYKFSLDAERSVYNSNMILYFASNYGLNKKYPRELLDPNIASDYNKIRRSFKIKGQEKENLVHLNQLVTTGELRAQLVRQYDLAKRFNHSDFISLLYYQGITTIAGETISQVIFKMPNYVIKQLYFQYFHQILLEKSGLEDARIDLIEKVEELALHNNIQPLIAYAEKLLQELSVRDRIRFDEKHIKTIFTSAFFTSGIYTIHNEWEVKVPIQQGKTGKGFVDLFLQRRQPYATKYQFVIEFKYIKQKEQSKLETVKAAAVEQLQTYLQHDDYLKKLDDLKAYVVVFVGVKGEIVEL